MTALFDEFSFSFLAEGRLSWLTLAWQGSTMKIRIGPIRTGSSHCGIDLLNCYWAKSVIQLLLMFGALGKLIYNNILVLVLSFLDLRQALFLPPRFRSV